MLSREAILNLVAKLKATVYHRGDRRAPHKPLLLLLALAKLRHSGSAKMTFREVEQDLRPLLDAFAPPVVGRHQPELPYWYLRSDGLWTVPGADDLPRQAGGFPRKEALRRTSGDLPKPVATALVVHAGLEREVVHRILEDHFPESLHEEVLDAVGLDLSDLPLAAHTPTAADGSTLRDPKFRAAVLRAYGHRCALTGFQLQLRGAHIGIEAAHVHWHSHGGPDTIANGVALQSTMHKLFDAGAWSLTDDRRVIVSQDLTGADETTGHLRKLHGTRLGLPLTGFAPVSEAFIRWHREPALGGVFRTPAMPL